MNKMRNSGLAAAVLALAALFSITGCSSGGGGSGDDFAGTFDATGSWKGRWNLESVGYSGSFSVKASQASGKLSGTITVAKAGLSDAPLTGTVTGNDVTFGDISGIVSFSGEADVFDAASGTFTVKDSGSTYKGTWTAACTRELALQKTVTLPLTSSFHSIAWDGTAFWVSDSQNITKLGTDGTVLASYMYNGDPMPLHDFHSLCWTELLALEDGLQDDSTKAMFFRINRTTGEPTTPLPCPPDGSSTNSSPSALSLAWDGSALRCFRPSDAGTGNGTLYKVNPSTGASLGSFAVPSDIEDGFLMPGGFGAAGSDLYVTARGSGTVYKMRSTDGKIVRRFTYSGWSGYPGGSPGSVTWDGSLLWIRDTSNYKLYGFTMPSGLAP